MTIKVLFIAAHSRSGSTILDRVLAQVEGAFTGGELRHIWQRSLIENQLCGCNNPFRDCPVWTEVLKESAITSKQLEPILDASRNVDRFKKLPLIMHSTLRSRKFENDVTRYLRCIEHIYSGIHKVASPEFIIDSSKAPNYGMLLSQMHGISLHVVHLVRDSRAVALSRLRRKKRPEIHWKDECMPVTSPYKTAIEWNLINYAIERLETRASYSLVRYEDFVKNPKSTVESILETISVRGKDLSFIHEDQIELRTNHTVSGNPVRFETGTIKLRPDVYWRNKLPRRYQAFLTLANYHLLNKYGYV